MTTHTPGPWKLLPQHHAGPMIVHTYETGNQMNPTGFRLIAHALERKDSLATDRANAAVLAAAPELLEALLRLLSSHWLSIDFAHNRSPEASDLRAFACAAIAKATEIAE